MNTTTFTNWFSTAPTWQPVTLGAVSLVALVVAYRVARAAVRKLRAFDLADVITVLVALAATVYAGSGNWKFLDRAMHYGLDLRVILVAVYEGAVIAEGLRSRRNIRDTGSAGADGVGLWVLTAVSGVMATSVSASLREALGRLAVPMVGAWLWERLLAPQRRAQRARRAPSVIRWRITRERIAVWLRLADSTETNVASVEAARRVVRFLRATDRESRGLRWPFTAAARADRTRTRLTTHALTTQADASELYAALSQRMLAESMNRLGISAPSIGLPESGTPELPESMTQELPNFGTSELPNSSTPELPESGISEASQESESAEVKASLPLRVLPPLETLFPTPDDDDTPAPAPRRVVNGKRVSPAEPARRAAAVTARVGVDRDSVKDAYRDSVTKGDPLTSRALARLTGVSQATAARIIAEVRDESPEAA